MSHLISAEIKRLCVDRMREAFHPGTGLFSRQLRNRRWESTEGTEEITSTAICQIAASRASLGAAEFGAEVGPMVSRVFDHCLSRYPGGLGLAIWMNAAWDGDALQDILGTRKVTLHAGELGVHRMTTMEASWMLCGLLHEYTRTNDAMVGTLVKQVHSEVLSRYHTGNGLFRHSSAFLPARDWIRKNVANFADQIYSVMAFSFDRIARDNRLSGDVASKCMHRLIELQGDLGQWWWHYDPSNGRIAGHFPVYSVHQHGMAPIALTAVSRFSGREMTDTIERSFHWLSRNESGTNLIDLGAGTIWRDIEPRRSHVEKLKHDAGMVLGMSESGSAVSGPLEINYETRPYEWGWCIYFGSLDAKPARGTHLI